MPLHDDRALRPIPMGRKIQTLLASCRMHEVNPTVYLIGVTHSNTS